MSTHSAIIVKIGDDKFIGSYCHFDGYLSGVGQTLLLDYKDLDKVTALINLGELRCIGSGITKAKGTEAYHRDCGEEFSAPAFGQNENEVLDGLSGGVEFVYVFKDGDWYHNGEKLTQEMIDYKPFA